MRKARMTLSPTLSANSTANDASAATNAAAAAAATNGTGRKKRVLVAMSGGCVGRG